VFYRYDKELYEYERPVHTLDTFTEEQYEVRTCEELLSVLNSLKDKIDISLRFSNMRAQQTDCCKKIAEEILR
jgi:regulatory protein YycH of two-component signal transduction system YycFG